MSSKVLSMTSEARLTLVRQTSLLLFCLYRLLFFWCSLLYAFKSEIQAYFLDFSIQTKGISSHQAISLYLPSKKKAFELVFLAEKTNDFSLKG